MARNCWDQSFFTHTEIDMWTENILPKQALKFAASLKFVRRMKGRKLKKIDLPRAAIPGPYFKNKLSWEEKI